MTYFGGLGGVPEIFFSMESSYFCEIEAHAKFQNPSCPLSGRKVRASEEEIREREERKITPTIGATTFVPAATGSARTPLGPK